MQTLFAVKPLVKATWTNGYNIFRIYCALKGHVKGSFDVAKYGLAIKMKKSTYLNRKDRPMFERIAGRLDAKDAFELIAFNLTSNPECIGYELTGADAYQYYLKKFGLIQRINTVYTDDLKVLFKMLHDNDKKFKELFIGSAHPVIIQLLMREEISLESVLIIDSFIPIIELMNDHYAEDILWQKWYLKLVQYRKLCDINSTLAKEVFLTTKANEIY